MCNICVTGVFNPAAVEMFCAVRPIYLLTLEIVFCAYKCFYVNYFYKIYSYDVIYLFAYFLYPRELSASCSSQSDISSLVSITMSLVMCPRSDMSQD